MKIFFKTLRFIDKATPDIIKSAIRKTLANLLFIVDKKHTKRAKANLNLVYPKKSYKEKKEIILASYENILSLLWQSFIYIGASKKELLERINFVNEEIYKEALNSNRPIILVTAHYGNWENGAVAVGAKFTQKSVWAVGRPLKQKWANNLLQKARGQYGVKLISKFGAMKGMIEVMRKKEVVGLVIDQNVTPREGVDITFFGKKATISPSASILAYKFNAIIIPVFSFTKDFKKHSVKFFPPIEIDKTLPKDEAIKKHSQEIATLMENIINSNPKLWLWIHRRWNSYYPHIYR